ncbi:MAG: MFS transporter [Deltaproteobacteria bacterium]|nr:MAG: MFS transporter [Deltaproteobacteria bacterium]
MPVPARPSAAERAGLVQQLTELDTRFWIVNTMEMFERLAYYGVRAVIALYMVLPLESGGPEFSHVQKGAIFAAWAAVQSLLPMFTGGFADRYGHKRTIAFAIVVKIAGYLAMAHFKSYPLFFLGCVLLAAGTAIFKPGVQGTLAATLKESNASVGWGIFYQLVNIGGFLGPVLAGVLRMMDWVYVFYACAIIVSINFLWLPFYRDPTEEASGRAASAGGDDAAQKQTWAELSRSVAKESALRWGTFFAALALAWFVVTFGIGAFAASLTGVAIDTPVSVPLSLALAGVGGGLCVVALVAPRLSGGEWLGDAALFAALALSVVVLAAGWHHPPSDALVAVGQAHEGLWGLLGNFAAGGSYLGPMGALVGGALLHFARRKAVLDVGHVDPGSVLIVSVAGLFQPRVLWFCLVFSGFWLMFNQVFDLLPNVIDDWVDSSGIIASLGHAFQVPAVPTLLAVLLAALWALVCGAIVMLAIRPDRRDRTAVGLAPWAVAGVGVAMASWFALAPVAGRISARLAEGAWAGTPLPTLAGLVPLLGVMLVVAAAGRLARPPGKLVAGVASVLAFVTGAWWLHGRFADAGPALVAMAEAGQQVNPEWMINLNPGLIVFTMIFFAWLSSFVRPLTSILVGMTVATLGSVVAGTAVVGWVTLAGILVFSIGEMLSSPKKMEYLASLAPRGQEGLFMGYANVPVAIGWISGSIFAGNRYEEAGDKANLARRYLVEERGWTEAAAEALPRSEVVETLARELSTTAADVRHLLFTTYHPERLWIDIGLIGLTSIVGMVIYDRVLRRIDRAAEASGTR